MWFQRVLKGINGIDYSTAESMLTQSGILSNWWRTVGSITPQGISGKLSERNLDWHLHRYGDLDPTTGAPFSANTPYISTTAGTVEPDPAHAINVLHDAFFTAACFATDTFRSDGFIFYGYVYTLGRPSIPLAEFAEEVRDLHVYTVYLPYRLEGELVAKISIPQERIQKFEHFSGPSLKADLAAGRPPSPMSTRLNPGFQDPQQYSNVRSAL